MYVKCFLNFTVFSIIHDHESFISLELSMECQQKLYLGEAIWSNKLR